MPLRHYVFEENGALREFTQEAGARVANGESALPEYADSQLRYLQVAVDDNVPPNTKVEVRMAVAMLSFNDEGYLTNAESFEDEDDVVSPFERQALAEYVLSKDHLVDFTQH